MARRTSTPTQTGAGLPRPAPSIRPQGNGATPTPGAGSAPARSMTAHREPSADEIRRRAYEIYLERRGVGGSPESDWLQAERELRGR